MKFKILMISFVMILIFSGCEANQNNQPNTESSTVMTTLEPTPIPTPETPITRDYVLNINTISSI